MEHAFEKMGMKRVEYHTDLLNQKSMNAMLKKGIKFEAVRRSSSITKTGRRRDEINFECFRRLMACCEG